MSKPLKRPCGVNNVFLTPYFLLDGNGNIVWQHNSYSEGDGEYELYDCVKKAIQGETISISISKGLFSIFYYSFHFNISHH